MRALKDNSTISDTLKKIATKTGDDSGPSSSMHFVQSSESKSRIDNFIHTIVDKLGTELALPETAVVSQDSMPGSIEEAAMFFITKGTCDVRVQS